MDREGPDTPGTFDAPASPHQDHAFPTTASERLQLALDAGAIIGTWVWDIPLLRAGCGQVSGRHPNRRSVFVHTP